MMLTPEISINLSIIPLEPNWGLKSMTIVDDEEGSALIEFSLLLPVLVLLFVGIVDFGFVGRRMMRICEAASAGVAYGTIPGNETNLNGMQAAATNSVSSSGYYVTATNIWRCTETGANVSSSTTCTNSTTPIQYVQVTTNATVPLFLQFAGLPSSIYLHQTAITRVGWHP